MMPTRARLFAALALSLLAAACGKDNHRDPNRPESYAVQLPVQTAAPSGLQRLPMPPAALVALQNSDYRDVRVFDASGKAMSAALLDSAPRDQKNTVPIRLHPIVGTRQALEVKGMTISIDAADQARIVGMEGAIDPASRTAIKTVAVLLDTRGLADPVSAIRLDADLPKGMPVTFSLASSDNLKDWSRLGESVMLRVDDGPEVLGGQRIALGETSLKGRYVLVEWQVDGGHEDEVAVRGASAETVKPGSAASVTVAATAPDLPDAHAALFSLPFATHLAALRIYPASTGGVVPVTLLGRRTSEDTWHPLARATLRSEDQARGALIEPGDGTWRNYRLEADPRSSGFAQAPRIELVLAPAALAVRFDGTPPYRLSAGLRDAPNTFLTASEVATNGNPAVLGSLPVAKAGTASEAQPVVTISPQALDKGDARLKWILWAVLAIGTLVLGYAALKLTRGTGRPE